MSIAALYNVHGNVPALDAVLEEISRLGLDQLVFAATSYRGPCRVKRSRVYWIGTSPSTSSAATASALCCSS
jgi:hypothetical protein